MLRTRCFCLRFCLGINAFYLRGRIQCMEKEGDVLRRGVFGFF